MTYLVAKASPDDKNTSTAEWSTYTCTVTCCSRCAGPPMRFISEPASNVIFFLSSFLGNTTCDRRQCVRLATLCDVNAKI